MLSTLFALSFAIGSTDARIPDVRIPSIEDQTRALQAHYAGVVEELLAEDVSRWNPAQRGERARLIEVLREFGECGEFGSNVDFPGARMPYFRDAFGRRCAVAELMHASGEDAFVESVRVARNHVWICDLEGDPEFERWLARVGFTIEDAARIHGPPVIIPPGGHGAGGQYNGPGDTTPTGGGSSSGGHSGGAAPTTPPSGPSGGGSSSGPGSGSPGPAPNSAPHIATMTLTSDDGWWLWWEYNKSEYLIPNRLSLERTPTTGDDPAAALKNAIAQARQSSLPIFVKSLSDGDANVRASAEIALGRVGGAAGIEKLLAMLDDPNFDVRNQAILALGATGTAEAVLPLLSIASRGSTHPDAPQSKGSISAVAKPLAIVALGLGRRRDFDGRIDLEIAKLIKSRTKVERESIGTAALIYQMLAPCKELQAWAIAMAEDETEAPSVRCRAIESLRSASDDATLSKLQHFLSGPRLDLRRSAALALGDFANPLALPALMTAFELEPEPLTRGLTLISIGKQGGEKARTLLVKLAEKGEGDMRRWTALALGIAARRSSEPDVTARLARAIRELQPREKNQDAMGAYWIASGLARDELARPAIRAALTNSADARQRMYAATALALVGGDASLELLRQRFAQETNGLVRVTIAQSLGIFGRAQDVPAMMDALMRLSEPYLQGVAASAMSADGTPEALRALLELAKLDSGSSIRRAASIEGLGMILGETPPLVFAEVSRVSNYTVFTDWVSAIFQTTL